MRNGTSRFLSDMRGFTPAVGLRRAMPSVIEDINDDFSAHYTYVRNVYNRVPSVTNNARVNVHIGN